MAPPFDAARLDALMGEQDVDAVLACSPHAVQHLAGGYRFFMYANLDAIGLSRYLPLLGYVRAQPQRAFYVGAGNEDWATEVEALWMPEVANVAWTSADAAATAARLLAARGLERAAIAVERSHLPADAWDVLRSELPGARFVEAAPLLEALRAVKTAGELDLIRGSAGTVVDAMLATFAATRAGDTKAAIADRLRRAESERGLVFDYCLVAAGESLNRAPSPQRIRAGDVVSLDSGAHLRGYVADLARMGCVGEPTAEMHELLGEVDAVQSAARAVVRAGTRGGDVLAAAHEELGRQPSAARMSFLAHGTGLVTHEAPRLTSTGSPPYPAAHADDPLLSGMVLSVETHVESRIGFVKLEDTVIVTADGCEPAGDHGRGFNVIGD